MHSITSSNYFTILRLEIAVPLTKAELISENKIRKFLCISVFDYFLFLQFFDQNVDIRIFHRVMLLFEMFMRLCEQTRVEGDQFQSIFL